MNAKQLVDSLFEGYEQTKALADFKEELLGNLNAKIENLQKKGMGEADAFAKASAELGDVSALADELSLKKRKEVFEEVYMDIRKYMPAARVAGYVAFAAVLLFGVITALIVWFSTRAESSAMALVSTLGALMPFFTAAVAGFTFLGITQETAAAYPVSKKRAAWYALASALIAFGLVIAPLVFFSTAPGNISLLFSAAAPGNIQPELSITPNGSLYEIIGALGVLLAFVLPGGGLLAFLVLTEKEHLKPWAKEFRDGAIRREMAIWGDPATAARFGMFSGAIWIFAIGLFILFGFVAGFKFSWLAFVFATAAQLLMQGILSKPGTGAQQQA